MKNKLQEAYTLARDILSKEYNKFEIRADAEGDPIAYWAWRMSGSKEYAGFKYNDNALIAVGKQSGDIGKGYFEYLNLALFIKRKMPDWKREARFFEKGSDTNETSEVYEKIKPEIIKIAPLITDLERSAFKEIVENEGYVGPSCTGNLADSWFVGEKSFEPGSLSLETLVEEIERLPKFLNKYFYWAEVI